MANNSLMRNVTEVFAKFFIKAVEIETHQVEMNKFNTKIGWDIHLEKISDVSGLIEHYKPILIASKNSQVKALYKQAQTKFELIQNSEQSESLLYNVYEVHAYLNTAIAAINKRG